MAHVGIALDHPLNAEIISYLKRRPSAEERQAAIRSLELMLAKRHSATLANSLHRLRNNTPDPPITPSQSPDGVNMMTLGALPDIVERLWKIGLALPADCRWVAYRRAVLAHSRTGIIFGVAVGTFGISLRLPEAAVEAAKAEGGTQRLTYRSGLTEKAILTREFGTGWWLFRAGKTEALALAAYDQFVRL